jgi:hypothetical protein
MLIKNNPLAPFFKGELSSSFSLTPLTNFTEWGMMTRLDLFFLSKWNIPHNSPLKKLIRVGFLLKYCILHIAPLELWFFGIVVSINISPLWGSGNDISRFRLFIYPLS